MRFLVVGCGSIGERHISNLITLNEEVAGCDIDQEKKVKLEKEYNIPFYNNFKKAVDDFSPHAVLVCTPNHLHLATAEEALISGSHVFIEKPIADRSEGTEKIIDLRDKYNKVVLIGCNLRFHPPVKYICEKVLAGEVGRLVSARACFGHNLPNWRPGRDYRKIYSARSAMGGGVLLDGIHEIDYLTQLFGNPNQIFSFNIIGSDLEIDVEDVSSILLKYDKALIEVHIDYLRHFKKRSCEIIGTKGTIYWESLGKNPEIMKVKHHGSTGEVKDQIEGEVDGNIQYIEELKHFINCIEGKDKPANPPEHAIQSLRIVELSKSSNISGSSREL